MTILFFGGYTPTYSRNRVLMRGLRDHGINVLECRVSVGYFRHLRLAWRLITMRSRFDAVLVAFPGQEFVWVAKLLTRKPVIFDALTSHYEGYVLDRKHFSRGSIRAWYCKFLDWFSSALADGMLVDTQAHRDFFAQEFGIPPGKMKTVYVGTDTSVMHPRERHEHPFLVHFHGNYIPLQGASYIVRSAALIPEIQFRMVGRGQEYAHCRELAHMLGVRNIEFLDPVSYERLAELLGETDICLGIFGDTVKTQRVIPNKVYEGLACGCTVVTADTPAIRELFTDGKDVLLCAHADPKALAHALKKLAAEKPLAKEIAERGRRFFQTNLTERKVVEPLVRLLNETISLRA